MSEEVEKPVKIQKFACCFQFVSVRYCLPVGVKFRVFIELLNTLTTRTRSEFIEDLSLNVREECENGNERQLTKQLQNFFVFLPVIQSDEDVILGLVDDKNKPFGVPCCVNVKSRLEFFSQFPRKITVTGYGDQGFCCIFNVRAFGFSKVLFESVETWRLICSICHGNVQKENDLKKASKFSKKKIRKELMNMNDEHREFFIRRKHQILRIILEKMFLISGDNFEEFQLSLLKEEEEVKKKRKSLIDSLRIKKVNPFRKLCNELQEILEITVVKFDLISYFVFFNNFKLKKEFLEIALQFLRIFSRKPDMDEEFNQVTQFIRSRIRDELRRKLLSRITKLHEIDERIKGKIAEVMGEVCKGKIEEFVGDVLYYKKDQSEELKSYTKWIKSWVIISKKLEFIENNLFQLVNTSELLRKKMMEELKVINVNNSEKLQMKKKSLKKMISLTSGMKMIMEIFGEEFIVERRNGSFGNIFMKGIKSHLKEKGRKSLSESIEVMKKNEGFLEMFTINEKWTFAEPFVTFVDSMFEEFDLIVKFDEIFSKRRFKSFSFFYLQNICCDAIGKFVNFVKNEVFGNVELSLIIKVKYLSIVNIIYILYLKIVDLSEYWDGGIIRGIMAKMVKLKKTSVDIEISEEQIEKGEENDGIEETQMDGEDVETVVRETPSIDVLKQHCQNGVGLFEKKVFAEFFTELFRVRDEIMTSFREDYLNNRLKIDSKMRELFFNSEFGCKNLQVDLVRDITIIRKNVNPEISGKILLILFQTIIFEMMKYLSMEENVFFALGNVRNFYRQLHSVFRNDGGLDEKILEEKGLPFLMTLKSLEQSREIQGPISFTPQKKRKKKGGMFGSLESDKNMFKRKKHYIPDD